MNITRFVSAIAVSLAICSAAHAAIPGSERDALIAFYESTNGDSWTDSSGWMGAPGTECSWFGIGCHGAGDTVTSIVLADNALTGSIPTFLEDLTNLEVLELRGNQLEGPIPSELGNLSELLSLELNGNKLTGSVPPELGNLSKLTRLILELNDLSGPLPPE